MSEPYYAFNVPVDDRLGQLFGYDVPSCISHRENGAYVRSIIDEGNYQEFYDLFRSYIEQVPGDSCVFDGRRVVDVPNEYPLRWCLAEYHHYLMTEEVYDRLARNKVSMQLAPHIDDEGGVSGPVLTVIIYVKSTLDRETSGLMVRDTLVDITPKEGCYKVVVLRGDVLHEVIMKQGENSVDERESFVIQMPVIKECEEE